MALAPGEIFRVITGLVFSTPEILYSFILYHISNTKMRRVETAVMLAGTVVVY